MTATSCLLKVPLSWPQAPLVPQKFYKSSWYLITNYWMRLYRLSLISSNLFTTCQIRNVNNKNYGRKNIECGRKCSISQTVFIRAHIVWIFQHSPTQVSLSSRILYMGWMIKQSGQFQERRLLQNLCGVSIHLSIHLRWLPWYCQSFRCQWGYHSFERLTGSK